MAQGNYFDQFDTPAQPTITPIPQSPQARRDEARDEERLDISRAGDARADRGEARADRNDAFDNAAKLRNEFQKLPQVVEYQTVIRQYNSALKTQPNPTGDQALITAYAKMLDPGSVVREQEFNTVAGGDSTIGKIVARLNKELGTDQAGLLRPEVRDRVKEEMLNLTKSYNTSYNQARHEYEGYAQSYGLPAQNVVGQHHGAPYLPQIQSALESAYGQAGAQEAATIASPQPVEDEGLVGGVSYEGPSTPGTYGDSALSQGLSGVNEGMASTLGLPVDAITGAMNLVPRGLNAAANTDIPLIEKPFLGSDWFQGALTNLGAIGAPSAAPSNQFARRVGQSVGATVIPGLGLSRTGAQAVGSMASGLGGGVGAATAQRVAPGNIGAEMAGEMIGGGLVGAGSYGMARRAATREMEAGIPTTEQLKQQAGDLYRSAEAGGVTADPMLTQDLADRIRGALRTEGRISPTGRISEVYPKAREAVRLVDDYAGSTMNPTQMQTVRKVMADGLTSTDANERRIAGQLVDSFDEWANPLSPQLPQARDIASRYLNAQQLEQARELAGARAGQFTGSGFENALRTEYRALDRKAIQGKGRYNMDMRNAIEAVSRGTPGSNAARAAGRLYPSGPVSAGLGIGAPTAIGTMMGGPAVGAAAGLTAGSAGIIGRNVATKMGIRNADLAELVARNGGKLPDIKITTPQLERLNAAIAAAQAGQYLE